ncbi:hypothetical protein B0H10DRAFT_2379381 [Mycena sp. CBHHK59/15]|nr:hypothetical protein B0H10DRAFT_2379381 [Mycena sp. CBHHK59/15]
MPPEVFEIHDPPLRPFDPALWIGKNKKFPAEDAHPEVHAAFAEVLKMPESHASLVPGPNLPITAFLELALPQKSSAMVFSTPESWFSKDAPTAEVDCLRSRSIPPRQFLDDLTKKAGQAWLDGRTSIVDHRYNDGHDRLPFWSLTLWKEWLRVVDDQKMWRKSRDWITSELSKPNLGSVDEEALMTASSLLDTLGWDTKIGSGWTTFNLALILSHAWLSDDHIDMMMADLSARVEADPELAAKVLITPLAFSNAVKDGANKKTYKREDTPLLARYEEHIKRTGVAQLYFPLHINNNHWIAGLVDFKQGDSRVNSSRPPTKFIKDLKCWLKKQFGRDFVYQGDSLEHGDQKDTSSCSVVCRNTIAMNVFGEALWEQKHAAGARATCFIRLLTAETPAEVSIAVALGDHNFPDLAEFALDIPARQSRPTLADLMNPAPATAGIADPLPADIEMPDAIPSVNTSSYAGDHGDVVPDDESADEQDPHEDDGKDMMDVDEDVPAPRNTLLAFFGMKGKAKPAVPGTLGKRSRNVDADLDESADIDAIAPAKRPKKANGTGTSKSAASAQKTRDALKSGELTVATADKTRYAAWQETLRTGKKGNGKNADPHVKFHPTDVKKARHSLCGTWVTMGEVYEAGRWNQHFKTACTALHPGKKMKIGDGLGGVPTLQSMGWMKGKSSSALRKPKLSVPCPGLTAATCPRLPVYLKRTGASGGGARSLTVIAKELFGRLARFSGLKAKEQDVVADTQRHERQWINDHAKQRVFSTNCKKQVLAGGLDGSRVLPCSECSSILGNSRFKQAIRLPIPADENYLYVNDKYRNQELAHIYARTVGLKEIIETADAKNTPCIKFAQGTLQGKYSNYKVFSGLVEAVVQKADRVERGVGMQNFKYAPAWDEMAHIINIHSPRAADALREHIPLRSHRTFRCKEAREPRFPMVIDDRTFTLVQEHLAALKYEGPVALSCDDTKLFAGLRLYHDKIQKADFLVGGVDGPIRVVDSAAMKKILADPTIVRGTKVRVWCLTVPLPGITPLVVAAQPIHDMTADELLHPLEKILYGLLDRKIRVISYACDGTEIERSLQRKLVEKADRVFRYKISSPISGAPDLEITIAFFRGYPVVMLQDSKHALKTFRNNLFTGAKLFTFGNFTAVFRRIFEMAMCPDSPLYHRDVQRLDRQDDAAACRLFCAAVLEYLSENHPEYIGEIVYLFIFGELVDAYQSREITHVERIKLALRARYFLDAWAKYLELAGYKQQQYFMSREAVDIAREPCEHTFGFSRRIVKDFTFLEFIFMAPKLRVTMREAVLAGKASNNAKSTAKGYNHTYFDTTGADLAKLAIYPSDDDIKEASEEAAAECESLVALLGVTPGQLYTQVPAPLPSIGSWFSDAAEALDELEEPVDSEEEFDNEEPSTCEAEELQALIDGEERLDAPVRSAQVDREFTKLAFATIAISVDDHMRTDEDLAEEILGDEHITLQETLASVAAALPPVQLPSEASKPFGRGTNTAFGNLDFKALVRQRKEHQTRQAANCARIKHTNPDESLPVSEESTRRQILRKYHELLKEDQARAVGTAVERKARWGTDPKPTAGNAANAAAAASAVATRAATRRTKLFKDAKLTARHLALVTNAGLTHFTQLAVGDFGIVWTELGLRVGKVETLYTKGGGKNGKHGAVTQHHNISAFSYIGVQVFELAHARQFRAIPQATSFLYTHQFRQLPPFTFLCRLTGKPDVNAVGLELSPDDANLFKDLNSGINSINTAVKLSKSRKKAAELDAEEDTTEDF